MIFYLIIIGIVLFLVCLKIYFKSTVIIYRSDVRMDGKVVIVTGSNTGIGYCTAEELARRGAKVILACRNTQKAITARDNIITSTGNKNVIYKHLDLASFKSVREFAADITKTESKLDVLINNAGTGKLDNSLTEDNLPIEAQINHFGPFLLTMLLLPLLKTSGNSRIVNVTSLMHRLGTIDNLDKQATNNLAFRRVYSNTKLANVLFTLKLAEYLKDTDVVVSCLHPGAVYTEMFRHQTSFVKFILNLILLSPLEGAQCSILLAVGRGVPAKSGMYYSNCKPTSPGNNALDKEAAEKLWKMSHDIVIRKKDT